MNDFRRWINLLTETTESQARLIELLTQWIDWNPLSGYEHMKERLAAEILRLAAHNPELRTGAPATLYRGFLTSETIHAGKPFLLRPRASDLLESWTGSYQVAQNHAEFLADEEAYHHYNVMTCLVIKMPSSQLDVVVNVGKVLGHSEQEFLVRPKPMTLSPSNVSILDYEAEIT